MTQRDAFLAGEADAWFERNRHALRPTRDDPVLRLLGEEGVRPASALEVGCANGWRLGQMTALGTTRRVGVDASIAAIEAGQQSWGTLDLRYGHAADPPIHDGETFELVILSFVLHWLDRADLRSLLKRLPDLLTDTGCVVVADFSPNRPKRVPYHHQPGLWTWKADYGKRVAKAIKGSVIAQRAFHHEAKMFWQEPSDIPEYERCAVWLVGR